jgi:hypothetical protein
MSAKMHLDVERAAAEAERVAALRRQARQRMSEDEQLAGAPRTTVREIRAAAAEKGEQA